MNNNHNCDSFFNFEMKSQGELEERIANAVKQGAKLVSGGHAVSNLKVSHVFFFFFI